MKKEKTLKSLLSIVLILALCVFLCSCVAGTDSQDPEQWKPTIKNCWCCALYGTAFEIINNFVSETIKACIPVSKVMLGIGLLFLMLQRIGSMMIFMPDKDAMGIWKELGIVFLKAIFVSALLYKSDVFLDAVREYVIYPIGGFFVMLSNAVLDSVPGGDQYFPGIIGVSPANKMTGLVATVGSDETTVLTDSIFGDLGIQVQYIVSRIFSSLKSGFPLVLRILANGGLFQTIIGLIIAYELLGLMIMFPVAFVDAFVMAGFYMVFLPIFLVLWVFPLRKQSQYLTQIFFVQLLSAFVDILFGCIVVVLMITLLQVYTDISLGGVLRETTQASNSAVADSFSNGRPAVLIFLVLVLAAKRMALEIGDFTEHFTGRKNELTIFNEFKKAEAALKKAALTLVELVAAIGTGGLGAVGTVARNAAKKAAQEAAKDVTGEGDKKGSSGGGAS